MKKALLALAMVAVFMVIAVTPALAAPGGTPALHGLAGEEWGEAVSELARSEAGAVAAHIHEMHCD